MLDAIKAAGEQTLTQALCTEMKCCTMTFLLPVLTFKSSAFLCLVTPWLKQQMQGSLCQHLAQADAHGSQCSARNHISHWQRLALALQAAPRR